VVDVDVSVPVEEPVVVRAAALDIAKASAMVCTRVPDEERPVRRRQQTWSVAADTASVLELGDRLRCQGIERVVMEATGAYWKPFFFLLEARGLECWLVNARDVKNVPGRPKTDRLDAVWLCKLNERGMLRASFVPPLEIRQLRDLTWTRAVLVRERTRHKQRVEKLLEDAQIKLSSVVSDLFGVTGRAVLEALVAGERSPAVLAELARGSLRDKKPQLKASLLGGFTEHHAFMVGQFLELIDNLEAHIAQLTTRIEDHLAAMEVPGPRSPDSGGGDRSGGGTRPRPGALALADRLDAITGVGPTTAQVIIAEIGLDMSRFPTPGHLASWAKLAPRTEQSGPVTRNRGPGRGNPWLKGALGEAAAAASRTHTFLGARYKRVVKRRGHARALVALAHSILIIAWHLVNDPQATYQDLGEDWHQRLANPARRTRDLVRQLEKLGHQVTLTPVPTI
jgi:transposase